MHLGEYSEIFSSLQLSSREAEVYELLLKSGSLLANQISKQTALSRTNTYNVVKKLEEKGLIESSKDGSYIKYSPQHPTSLQNLLLEQKRSLENSQTMLTAFIDNLIDQYNLSSQKPGVSRFEGKEGLKRVYDEILKDALDIDIIMNRPLFRKFIGEYNDHFVSTRKRYSIKTRVITPDNEIIKSDDQADLRTVRYLAKKDFPFEIDLKITKKRVVITTLKEDIASGITIIDPEIAINFKLLFEIIWSIAGER